MAIPTHLPPRVRHARARHRPRGSGRGGAAGRGGLLRRAARARAAAGRAPDRRDVVPQGHRAAATHSSPAGSPRCCPIACRSSRRSPSAPRTSTCSAPRPPSGAPKSASPRPARSATSTPSAPASRCCAPSRACNVTRQTRPRVIDPCCASPRRSLPIRACAGRRTKTRTASGRTSACTWWPTAWAATPPARSRRGMAVEAIEASSTTRSDADVNRTWPFPYDTDADARRQPAEGRVPPRQPPARARRWTATTTLRGMATTAAALLVGTDDAGRRARRRQPRLPLARRQARAGHAGSLLGERAGARGRADRRPTPAPSVAQRRHARAGRRRRSRSRRLGTRRCSPAIAC